MSESMELGKRSTELQAPAGVSELVQLARDGVSVDALERLVALVERTTERNARMAYVEALSAFRDACPPIPKTRLNRQFTKINDAGVKVPATYAGLEDIDRIARPVASRHGLTWTWDTTVDANLMHVTCKVLHVDGHSETATVSMPYESKAGASPQQKYAITQTYGMRYSLIAALGITTADDDVDGNAGTGEAITDAQLADLQGLVDEILGGNEDMRLRFLKWASETTGAETLADIPQSSYQAVVNALESKR